MNGKNALVTGGSGFVGRYLILHLREHGWRVVNFDIRDTGVDLREYEHIRAAVEYSDPDAIFHLAAQAYVPEAGTDPRRGVDVNVVGTLNLLEAVRHTGCRARLLLAGTSEEYGYETQDGDTVTERSPARPTTVYGVTKLAAGQLGLTYARTYGMNVVVTRAWNHTGPGQPSTYAVSGFARQAAEVVLGRRTELRHGNLDAARSYLDVRDVVRAYVQAIDLPTGICNVAVPHVVRLADVLTMVLVELDRRGCATVPLVTDPALYRPGLQRGGATFPTPSSSKLQELTGWRPEYTLEATIHDLIDHWCEVLT